MKLHILCLSQTPSMCKGWPSQVLQSSTTNHIIGLPSASSSVGRLSETGPDAWSYQGGSYGTTVVLKKSKNQFSSITMVLKFLKQLLIRLLVLEHENCRFWEIFWNNWDPSNSLILFLLPKTGTGCSWILKFIKNWNQHSSLSIQITAKHW